MKLLFITYHYLFQNNGGSNCSKCLLKAFASLSNDMSLIYPEQEHKSDTFIPPRVIKYPCYDNRSLISKGIDVYRGYLTRYEHFVPDHLKSHHYDIIVLDHSIVASGCIKAIKKTGSKIITIHHNVERNYTKDNLPLWLYRIPYRHYSEIAERESLESSCVNLCVTPKDCRVFQSWYHSADIHAHYLGAFEYEQLPDYIDCGIASGVMHKRFIISGSLCFRQSNEPILDFIRRYYPIIKKECPDWEMEITGRNPSTEMQRTCSNNDILLVPNPENIVDEISMSSVYICPIYGGSGLKLRIMDGLRQGLPVICHQNASSGYEAIREAGFLFEYHDEESFRMVLREVMLRKFDRQKIYKSYYSNFSLEIGIERLRKVLVEENILF